MLLQIVVHLNVVMLKRPSGSHIPNSTLGEYNIMVKPFENQLSWKVPLVLVLLSASSKE